MEKYLSVLKNLKSGVFHNVYLCFGENQFFYEKFLDLLKKRLFSGVPSDFNFEVIDSSGRKVSEIIDSANQFPVFSLKRLVLAYNFKNPKNKDEEEFLNYIKSPSLGTILVIKFKDAKISPAITKGLGKNGVLIKFQDPYENELPYWIKTIASSYSKVLEPKAVDFFINFVGNDLKKIDSEIAKLSAYVGGREKIKVEDVDALVSDTRVDTVFEFIDSIGAKNFKNGLRMLKKMTQMGEAPQRIILMLARHYRLLWKIKKGMKNGLKGGELAQHCGISPYFISNYMDQAKNSTFKSISGSISLIARADLEQKTLRLSKNLLLEKLCFDLART